MIDDVSVSIRLRRAPEHVVVCTYKSAVVVAWPGGANLWLSARDALKIAGALTSAAKVRIAMDKRAVR
jgi:hypothetical protein